MNGRRIRRFLVATIGLSLLAAQVSAVMAAPPGGTSKSIVLTGVAVDDLGDFRVSAGESVPFKLEVRNSGRQTLNNVSLFVGRDDNPVTAANGDATLPVAFPPGVQIAAGGCTGGDGELLTCPIGTLAARTTVTFDLVITTDEAVEEASIGLKGTVKVAEGGNDSGLNVDTFAIEGNLDLLGFSCDAITVYRPSGTSKTVDTCGVDDPRNENAQSARVKLPSNLSVMTLQENLGAACPPVSGLTCIGDEVEADITGDTTKDVISWTIEIKLNGQRVNLSKLIVYHYNDAGDLSPAGGIALTKKNACKTASSINCGSATVSNDVLTVTLQTAGNGKTRLLG